MSTLPIKGAFGRYLSEVRDWNLEAGHLKQTPDHLDQWESDTNHRLLAVALIEEEVGELREAVEENDSVEILDALADILFTVFGLAAKSGHAAVLEDGLHEVISSNWTKLDGEPVVLPSGKIGKPESYRAPDLKTIVDKATKRGIL